MTPPPERPMLSLTDIAKLIEISRRTAQTWLAAGKLPTPDLKIGRTLRWRATTIDEWLNTRPGVHHRS